MYAPPSNLRRGLAADDPRTALPGIPGQHSDLKLGGGKRRFELFYFDFALGVMAMALVCGFTFGNWGFDGFSLLDDFIRAGKRQWLYGFLAGVLFNLGNTLLVAAIAMAGLAVTFSVGGRLHTDSPGRHGHDGKLASVDRRLRSDGGGHRHRRAAYARLAKPKRAARRNRSSRSRCARRAAS